MSTSGQSSSEPPRRQRKVHPKTRTGCKTCKIRKVKCDEVKPFCNRCTSTGRKCDGYPSTEPMRYSPARSATPPSSNTLTGPSSLVLSIPGTSAEKRSFQYFVTNTAAELAGYFNEEFWKGFVLKASLGSGEGVGALRHAVVGIAALHEEFVNDGVGERGFGVESGFAVTQYSKAITHLRQTLTTTNVSDSPLIALMSSALFVSFDTLRGSTASAMVHLQSGLKILKDARAQLKAQRESKSRGSGKGMSREEEFIMEKYIAPLLVRLSVQAILYLDTRGIEEKLVMARALGGVNDRIATEVDSQLQDTANKTIWIFESLEHAREIFNMAAEAHFRTVFLCDPRLSWAEQSPEVQALNKKAFEYKILWTEAFSAWMTIHTPTLTTGQIRGATILKVHACVMDIMHEAMRASINETRPIALATNVATVFAKPKVIELFATIVTLCRSLVNAVESETNNEESGQQRNVFSTDLGIVGPLYYVATKCTVSSMRTEAIGLLKRWKGREGMWDASMSIKLATDFWEIESKFGKRGYDMYDESWESEEQNKEKRKDASRNRGNVCLQIGESGRWEWKVSLDLEMADARIATVQDKPISQFVGAGLDFDLNSMDLSAFNDNIDGLFNLDENLPLDFDRNLQIDQPLYSTTTPDTIDDWMSMLYFQGQGDDQYLPTFTLQDYGYGMGIETGEIGFQYQGNVSTPGSYTNSSESAISNWDDLLLGRF